MACRQERLAAGADEGLIRLQSGTRHASVRPDSPAPHFLPAFYCGDGQRRGCCVALGSRLSENSDRDSRPLPLECCARRRTSSALHQATLQATESFKSRWKCHICADCGLDNDFPGPKRCSSFGEHRTPNESLDRSYFAYSAASGTGSPAAESNKCTFPSSPLKISQRTGGRT